MELTYTNANGESVTLRQTRPFFLTRVDGAGKVRQTVNTFKAPDQDGAFFISSAMDMRNITLEGSVITPTVADYCLRGDLCGTRPEHRCGCRHQLCHLDLYGLHGAPVLHPVQDRLYGKIYLLGTLKRR